VEYEAAELAFQAEVGRLKSVHESKTLSDMSLVSQKREDMMAFWDISKQELPAAERLEEIAKGEMSRWIEEMEVRSEALSTAISEYQVREGWRESGRVNLLSSGVACELVHTLASFL
jgi:hypothetical protein